MMSMGIASGGASSERAEKETSPHPITRTWSAADATMVLSTFTVSLSLLHFRHQRHAAETRGREPPHHLHDRTVVDLLVSPDKNTLIEAAARIGDRLQLRHEIIDRNLGVVEEDLALQIDGQCQRVLLLVQAFRLRLRQIERHAHGQERRRDHEDDQEHEHDIDHRCDVDLRHHRLAPAVAASAARRTCRVHRHLIVLIIQPTMQSYYTAPHARSSIWRDKMAENSSAKPSRRCACLFTSEVNLL